VQRLAWLGEPVARERSPLLSVVFEGERDTRSRLGEDLVEQVQVFGMDVVQQLVAAILLQPRPGDDPAILDPETDLPLGLAALVLAQAPRDVTHMPRRTQPKHHPLLKRELLHSRDDLRRQSHNAEYPRPDAYSAAA
jgi:hypothetical protein